MRGTMPRPPPAVQYFGHLGETAAHRSTMSFILDALKKSENSRLRQDHPAIFDAQAAAVRRQGLPRWGIALMVLLGLNLLILAYALWRPSEPPAAVPTVQPESPTASAAAHTAAAPAQSRPALSRPALAAPAPTAPALAAPPSATSTRPMAAPPSVARRSTPPAFPVSSEENPLRFVLLNGQRLREGEVSREGLRVEQILPSGVLLSTGGTSFMLSIN